MEYNAIGYAQYVILAVPQLQRRYFGLGILVRKDRVEIRNRHNLHCSGGLNGGLADVEANRRGERLVLYPVKTEV